MHWHACWLRNQMHRHAKEDALTQTLTTYLIRQADDRIVSTLGLPLQWRHNGRDSVSNHQPHHRLLNGLFERRSKKTSKLRVTGLCAGNSPVTGEFPAQMASNAANGKCFHLITSSCTAIKRTIAPRFPAKLASQRVFSNPKPSSSKWINSNLKQWSKRFHDEKLSAKIWCGLSRLTFTWTIVMIHKSR